MKLPRLLPFVVVPILGVGLLHAGGGCESATMIAADAGHADAPFDTSRDRTPPDQSSEPDGGDGSSQPVPCSVQGYLLEQTYDPACGFCYPESKDSLPSPIGWRACDAVAAPAGLACRQMVEDWTPAPTGDFITARLPAWVQSDQTVTLMLTRLVGTLAYRLVADVDGPVHSAVLETTNACTLGVSDIRDGYVGHRIFDSESGALSEFGGGSFAMKIDDLQPQVFTHYHGDTTNARTYYVASSGLFEIGSDGSLGIRRYDWGTGAYAETITAASPDPGFAISYLLPRSRATFWESYAGTNNNKFRVWTRDGGPEDFIAFGSPAQGVLGLGTDEKDLVWQFGSGIGDSGMWYAKFDTMTAPFVTDPKQLAPRRLRSGSSSESAFSVGCGYAAQAISSSPNELGLRVIRLSDGWSWPLETLNSSPWIWTEPVALTCTELFALVLVKRDSGKSEFTVVRVRLDSLGPGVAPD